MLRAAISSSACSKIKSNSTPFWAINICRGVAGVIGYEDMKLQPPARHPIPTASVPLNNNSSLICGSLVN